MSNRGGASNGRHRTNRNYGPDYGIGDYQYYKGGQPGMNWSNIPQEGNNSLYDTYGGEVPPNNSRQRSPHPGQVYQNYNPGPRNAGSRPGSKRESVQHIWAKHSERTSLNGIPYIHGSKNPMVKVFWIILLLAAVGGMVWHLQLLLGDYFDYETSSQIIWQNERIEFPAITFCNVNPIKKSKVHLANQTLQDLIAKYEPSKQEERLRQYNQTKIQPGKTNGNDRKNNLIFDDLIDENEFEDTEEYDASEDGDAFEDSWEDQARSGSSIRYERFLTAYNQESEDVRDQMAHQLEDMLVSSTFRQRRVAPYNYTMRQSNEYGNCYTLDNDAFIARESGPKDGLDIILALETFEYLSGYTASKGLQLVIHESKTVAYPSDEGIAINAGAHTQIGLRKVELKRLKSPYESDCANRPAVNGFKYTRLTCQKTCYQRKLLKKCKCYELLEIEANLLIEDIFTYPACSQGSKCMQSVEDRFDTETDCDCPDPCAEITYKKTISSRQWPDEEYAKILLQSFCADDHEGCASMESIPASYLPNEFLRLTIFFEDLNYEQLQETAQYEDSQFFSDVGGAIGLWIGLSLMGIFEIIHFFVDIFVHLCCTRRREREQN